MYGAELNSKLLFLFVLFLLDFQATLTPLQQKNANEV